MRLLRHTSEGELALTRDLIGDDKIPPYAILSHTWTEDQEVTYDDLIKNSGKSKTGYAKLRFCASQSKRDGLQHFWIDSCCIDKTNHTELSEAIISMFRWYKNAKICYVYLSDVSSASAMEKSAADWDWQHDLGKSRWFTRGWTLQELIAPVVVHFFSKEGTHIGNKRAMAAILHDITGIAVPALEGSPMDGFPVDERMSWAQDRHTKREEDAAYSLLGLFDVQMPPLYGEGRQKAMDRLWQEIREHYAVDLPVALDASYNSHTEEHNARCLPNTRTALLKQIATWAQHPHGRPIFWLSGAAGTGKSTVARTIAESFDSKRQLGASFFFKKGEGERGNASRFFTTIATDLVARRPGILPLIKRALDKDSVIAHRDLGTQFKTLILQPLLEIEQTHPQAVARVVVIDALDECEQEDDIRKILELLALTKDSQALSLRIVVTSRPELHIRLGFKQMPDGTHEDLVLHEVPRSTIEHDILVFLLHEFNMIREVRSMSSDWPTTEQVLALVELAVPLFIYAATVCRYIGTKGGNPKKNLEKILNHRKSAFSQMDQMYLFVLSQLLDEQEDDDDKEEWLEAFRKIVGGIILLQDPLPARSLAHLLQVAEEEVDFQLDPLHSVLNITNSEDDPIRILHLSFRDFLLDPRKKGGSPFWVDERMVHKNLAFCCLEVMSRPTGLRQRIDRISETKMFASEANEIMPPELRYACRYWVHHLQRSQQVIFDGDTTHAFLEKHYLQWLEVQREIIGWSEPDTTLYSLLAQVDPSASNVLAFLHDAERFVQRGDDVVFVPEASIVRQICRGQVRECAELLSTREPDWDSGTSTLGGHSDWVMAVAFSADGQLAASASTDRTIRIWEVATGKRLYVLEGHSDWVIAVAFSPYRLLIASASADKTVRLWDVTTGKCLKTLADNCWNDTALACSPDGGALHTTRGTLPLSGDFVFPSPFRLHHGLHHGSSNIQVQDGWILRDQERLLMLPGEYGLMSTAILGDLVCLGLSSGRVIILRVLS